MLGACVAFADEVQVGIGSVAKIVSHCHFTLSTSLVFSQTYMAICSTIFSKMSGCFFIAWFTTALKSSKLIFWFCVNMSLKYSWKPERSLFCFESHRFRCMGGECMVVQKYSSM